MKTIGEILPNGTIVKSLYQNGYIYKNFDAFENKSDEICYVPELSCFSDDEDTIDNSDTYTYKDIIDIIDMYKNDTVDNYMVLKNNTIDDIAKLLFDHLDWQHPETLFQEWIMEENFLIKM